MSHYFWCFCFSNTLALTFTECFHAVCMTVRCLTWSSEEERQQAARVEGGLRKLFGPKFRVACKQRSRYGLRVSITTIALLQSMYIKSTVFLYISNHALIIFPVVLSLDHHLSPPYFFSWGEVICSWKKYFHGNFSLEYLSKHFKIPNKATFHFHGNWNLWKSIFHGTKLKGGFDEIFFPWTDDFTLSFVTNLLELLLIEMATFFGPRLFYLPSL